MSRHALVIKEPYPDRQPVLADAETVVPTDSVVCVVGWDRPLGTFFAQGFIQQADDDLRDRPPLFWVGGDFGEITSVEALQEAIAGWVVLPRALVQQLQEEQAAEPPRLGRPAAQFFAWLASGQES